MSTPGPTTASLPAAPPLQPFSFVDSTSPSSGFLTPNPSSDTPSTDAGVFTPQSTTSTAFTTPESSKTLWGDSQQQLRRVGEAAAKPPIGFEFLDGEFEKETGSLAPRSFDWEGYVDISSDSSAPTVFKRRLGPTEVSYYLGSRGEGVEGGVNDMYLHLGFKAPSNFMSSDRILDVWTDLTSRHTLLASSVEFNDYYDICFRYDVPHTAIEARAKAQSLLDIRTSTDGKVLLDSYLNDPRTLSDRRLAYLVISTSSPDFSTDSTEEQEYDFFLFSTHFLGDGVALHTTANEFFTLLGKDPVDVSPSSLLPDLDASRLAPAMESKLLTPTSWNKLGWTAATVEFKNDQAKLIGGHAFPRAKLGIRKTLDPTVSYDATRTRRILGQCKKNGVTIAAAAFVLANAAFIRSVEGTGREKKELPTMIYSALNVRPYLSKEPADFYHIAIGYYNVILPSFFPSSVSPSTVFWHQALSVRSQTSKAVKSPFLAAHTALMALERERRSIGWEREDDDKRAREATKGLQGLVIAAEEEAGEDPSVDAERLREAVRLAMVQAEEAAKVKKVEEKVVEKPTRPKVPSTALMGCSMLGNLDAMYKHAEFGSVQLHTLTTGSRQRPSSLLLFAYTFAGQLWFSLGYDSHGFEAGSIEKWWDELLKGVDEFLLEEEP